MVRKLSSIFYKYLKDQPKYKKFNKVELEYKKTYILSLE